MRVLHVKCPECMCMNNVTCWCKAGVGVQRTSEDQKRLDEAAADALIDYANQLRNHTLCVVNFQLKRDAIQGEPEKDQWSEKWATFTPSKDCHLMLHMTETRSDLDETQIKPISNEAWELYDSEIAEAVRLFQKSATMLHNVRIKSKLAIAKVLKQQQEDEKESVPDMPNIPPPPPPPLRKIQESEGG